MVTVIKFLISVSLSILPMCFVFVISHGILAASACLLVLMQRGWLQLSLVSSLRPSLQRETMGRQGLLLSNGSFSFVWRTHSLWSYCAEAQAGNSLTSSIISGQDKIPCSLGTSVMWLVYCLVCARFSKNTKWQEKKILFKKLRVPRTVLRPCCGQSCCLLWWHLVMSPLCCTVTSVLWAFLCPVGPGHLPYAVCWTLQWESRSLSVQH